MNSKVYCRMKFLQTFWRKNNDGMRLAPIDQPGQPTVTLTQPNRPLIIYNAIFCCVMVSLHLKVCFKPRRCYDTFVDMQSLASLLLSSHLLRIHRILYAVVGAADAKNAFHLTDYRARMLLYRLYFCCRCFLCCYFFE